MMDELDGFVNTMKLSMLSLDVVLELRLGLGLYCTVLRLESLKPIPPAWMKRDKKKTF
jgi:hypothetical protein